jgi:hypothetical protein
MFCREKISPPTHFFFMRKVKNNKNNICSSVVKKHFGQTFSPASRSRCIFKNSDSRRHKVFFMQSLRCCSCCRNVRMRSQQCCRDCSDVAEIAAMSHLSHAISATTATLQRLHATNETQKMCHVALPKGRQSGVSHVQQRGLNLTDNTTGVLTIDALNSLGVP